MGWYGLIPQDVGQGVTVMHRIDHFGYAQIHLVPNIAVDNRIMKRI
jgi:hypothetical protein